MIYHDYCLFSNLCAHTSPGLPIPEFPNPVPIPLALELRRCVCFPLVVAWRVNKRIHQSNARKRTQKWQYERGGSGGVGVPGYTNGMRNPNQKPKPTPSPIPKPKPKPKLKPKATSKRAPKSVFNMHVRHVFLTQEKWMKFLSYIYRALPRGAECERKVSPFEMK